MAISWTDMPMTAAQRTRALELVATGQQVPDGPLRVVPGLIPTNTIQDAKRAAEWLTEMAALLSVLQRGTQYTMLYYRTLAAKAYEDANP